MFVYVISKTGQPLMPTTRFGKVRRLLRDKKAKVVRSCPFTIKLRYEPETLIVQEVVLGQDTGSKHVGTACASNEKVLYQSEVTLRDDIKNKMDRRRGSRRNRRYRKTRYRKPRFLNRANSIKKDRLPPSVRYKVQAHVDEIEFCKKILPVSDLVFETGKFDTQLMEKPWLQQFKWAYQKGVNYGFANARAHALDRDNYTCQCCGKKHVRLEVHHIVFRSQCGSDELDNLITLCEKCHVAIHDGKITLNLKGKRKRALRYATQISIIRSQLLKIYPDVIETFGFVTKANSENLGIEKKHYLDACVIASGGKKFKQSSWLFKKRRVARQNRQLCKGARGEIKLPTGKILGFRKCDKVKYLNETCFIKSRSSRGYFTLMDIDRNTLDFRDRGGYGNPPYKLLERLNLQRSTLYIGQWITGSEV